MQPILSPHSHEYFMQEALKQAELALSQEEIPIGAVVVSNQKIVGRGYNMVQQLRDTTAHAEMIALTAATNHLGSKYLSEATMYVTVEPCLMCAGAMYWSKIGTVVYGTADIKNGYAQHFHQVGNQQKSYPPFHPKTNIIRGVLEAACAHLITNFFKERR